MALVFLTILSAFLGFSSACIDKATRYSETPMPGGWFVQNLNDVDENGNGAASDAAALAQLALNNADDSQLKEWNGPLPTIQSDDIEKVFYQIVAGVNYCIQFSLNGGSNGAHLTCEAKAFQPLQVFANDGSQTTTSTLLKCY